MVTAAPAPHAQAASPRFIALDSLRGLAAVAIVFYHMGPFGWIAGAEPFRRAWLLVEYFFVLSGFVIAMSYGAKLAQGYPRAAVMKVRLGRVLPLHIVTVALFVLLEIALFRPVLGEAHGWAELVRGALLLDTFITSPGNFYAPVSWAVGVELALYALAAVLFGRGRTALAITMLLVAAAAWALIVEFSEMPFGRLIQRGLVAFPLGVLGWEIHRRTRDRAVPSWLLTALEIATLTALVLVLADPHPRFWWIVPLDLLFLAIVLVFARDGGLVSRALAWRPFVWLGQMSFALYMVHLFWVILPNRLLPGAFAVLGHRDWIAPTPSPFGLMSMAPPPPVATALTLALLTGALVTAWLAFRFVEEPARHWSRRFAPPRH